MKFFISTLISMAIFKVFAFTTTIGGVTYEYDFMEDGVRILEIKNFTTRNVILPSSIGGVDVVDLNTNLWRGAVNAYHSITNAVLPNRVKRIHSEALNWLFPNSSEPNCTIYFPKTLELLDEFALYGTRYMPTSGITDPAMYPPYYGLVRNAVFFGPPPEITNEKGLSWSSEYRGIFSGGQNNSGGKVFVADLYYNDFKARCVYQSQSWLGKKEYLFCMGMLTRGVSDVNIMPNNMIIHKNANAITLEGVSTNSTMQIFYTLDGSIPVANITQNCFLYEGDAISICHPTTISAIAVASGYQYYAVETMDYSVDQPEMPIIAAVEDKLFDSSNYAVAISCLDANAIIRYTVDGTAVTDQSPIYNEDIILSDTTTIRAKAYEEGRFDSEEAEVTFTRVWYTVDSLVIDPDGCEFDNASQEVNISCATDGATVYYTIDGSDPATNGKEYRHSFTVYNSCTVRAVAIKDDWKNSEIAEALFTRGEELSAAANFYGYKLETGDDAWLVDGEVSHDGVSSIKSNGSGSYVQCSVRGAGTLSFWWRAMCEEPEGRDHYDYGVFKVGESCVAYIAGNDTGWQFFSTNITTTSKHLLRWEYQKDEEGAFAPDCVWIDQVQWVPANGSGFTMTTPEPVPYSWFPLYNFANYDDLEALGNAPSGKIQGGRQTCIWEEYVAGTDPTDENDIFKATITFDTEGEPVISWTPKFDDPNEEEKRIYRKFGKVKLNDKDWTELQDGEEVNYNFFKVTVEMR